MPVGRDDEPRGVVQLERIISPFRNSTGLADHRHLLSPRVENPHDVRFCVADQESPVAAKGQAGRLAFE